MKKLTILILVCLFTHLIAVAKTLVVTHPQKDFDPRSTAGHGTLSLLKDKNFKRKLVLIKNSDEPNLNFTFPTDGLKFETIKSAGGNLSWVDGENEITLAGGWVSACMHRTLVTIIQNSRRDLDVTLPMNAIYALRLDFAPPKSIDGAETENLSNMETIYGNKIFLDFLVQYGSYILSEIPLTETDGLPSGRMTSEFKAIVKLDGKIVSTSGRGTQKVNLNFVR